MATSDWTTMNWMVVSRVGLNCKMPSPWPPQNLHTYTIKIVQSMTMSSTNGNKLGGVKGVESHMQDELYTTQKGRQLISSNDPLVLPSCIGELPAAAGECAPPL